MGMGMVLGLLLQGLLLVVLLLLLRNQEWPEGLS
jgi:hypothetical protein